jgi:hypothetical protein
MPEGYNLKDLMKPDRVKVQKALSGIINLQKFRESVQDDYDVHVRKTVSGRRGGGGVWRAETRRWHALAAQAGT